MGAGRQNHGSAVGLDQLLVGGQRVERRLVHGEADQRVAGKAKRDLTAGPERHRAESCGDHTFVCDLLPEQGDVAPVGRADRATVDDGRRATSRGEGVAAGREVRIGQAERGGDDAADLDPGAVPEEHAVRIQHEHLAVGGEAAEDE